MAEELLDEATEWNERDRSGSDVPRRGATGEAHQMSAPPSSMWVAQVCLKR